MSDRCAPRRGLFAALCALDRVYRGSGAPTRKAAEAAMAARVVRACEDLGSVVTALAS
jgi:hypothetical protein